MTTLVEHLFLFPSNCALNFALFPGPIPATVKLYIYNGLSIQNVMLYAPFRVQ